jgi:predicted site-specific integrase-resolvase
VTVEVLYPKQLGGHDELLQDFISLAATFSGRLYGLRSAANRRRLLAACDPGTGTAMRATGHDVAPASGER